MSALFENAIGSIRVGVQDYNSTDEHRHVSAVRNFYAGILLLAKEVLVRRFPNEDPDTLLASNLKPVSGANGTIQIVPATKNTIDFATVGRRFKDLGIPFDHGSLEELNKIRNEVEHKFSRMSRNAITEAIAKGFPVTGQLFRLIDQHPASVLGSEWQIMLETREMFEIELAECRKTVNEVAWHSPTVQNAKLICSSCDSNLVQQADSANTDQDSAELSCRACGEKLDTGEVVERTVGDALSFEVYTRAKETGEDGPIYTCPECSLDTYIDFEESCAHCGQSIESRSCAICEATIPLSDLIFDPDMNLCSYHEYVMNKDD